jgi:hypothetical protein
VTDETTMTLSTISHGIEPGVIITINSKLYTVTKSESSTSFKVSPLRFYEIWYYRAKYYFKEFTRYCKKTLAQHKI